MDSIMSLAREVLELNLRPNNFEKQLADVHATDTVQQEIPLRSVGEFQKLSKRLIYIGIFLGYLERQA